MKSLRSFWFSGIFCFVLIFVTQAFMAGAQDQPKYKVQTLKIEAVPLTLRGKLIAKKVLMVIAPKDFQDQEFIKPKTILENKGVKINIASTSLQTATGMYGLKVKPEVLIKSAKANQYDAIIFVGGNGASSLADESAILSLVREAEKNKKIIGAICIAPVILAKAGVLEGKKATVSPYGIAELKKVKALYTGKKVEVDGNIITGSGPAAAEEFGNTLVRALSAAPNNQP